MIVHHSSIDDYKFVKNVRRSTACVFSLKNNSWKCIEDSRYECQLFVLGTLLNGDIHWVLEHQGGDCVIAAFDLVEERFKDLPLPDALTNFGVLSTGVLDGRLCVEEIICCEVNYTTVSLGVRTSRW
ncbi:hypothetical protein Ddye_022520 [Dipteronia dyeriana]|uniref:F-box associated beta-propeller type 1 domain-containing protein n=1 Tax=Dipteronia dyeriana TaxID=168575 RepID=A0AAD9WSG5_9ROSI|nr:hypothetical protein Ddye_022520 [Dipteronia dyeriana]